MSRDSLDELGPFATLRARAGAGQEGGRSARDRYGRELPEVEPRAPGRATPTSRLPASARVVARALAAELHGDNAASPVQAKGTIDVDSDEVHALAARGMEGTGASLPFLDQIQRAFGRHDVSGVKAHVGGVATAASQAMGARAYASGDRVAFAGAPDLHTSAHEAAHVVQQRGGVQLAGGVGRSGDEYEQHADAVADSVVRGVSAEPLLDRYAGNRAVGHSAVQRLDSHETVGNTLSATSDERGGELDERSRRRVYERIAQLEGRDPVAAGREFDAMPPDRRASEFQAAVSRFQASHAESIEQIREDNDVRRADGSQLYDPPAHGRRSRWTAPRAGYEEGAARPNDVTMQALANAWPQTILGREMNEQQAYEVLRRLVLGRGLPFDAAGVNVIGMRAYQGGEIHDNGEPAGRVFTGGNRFDDTLFTLMPDHHVEQTRGTVDPGGPSHLQFQVAADQQWDYRGNARGTSAKYDRPMYSLADPEEVERGSYWQEHPEEVAAATPRGANGRLVRRPDGDTELDRDRRGRPRMVSAVHSGGDGRVSGEQVGGDSTGCSVAQGAWFPHFNESLRRGAGGDQVRFTYSLIDPRTFSQRELAQILDSVVPATTEPRAEESQGDGEDASRQTPYEVTPAATPARSVHPDGALDPSLDPNTVHRAAESGVAGGGDTLPHFDAIQHSFGHHDVTGVRAHVGGPAATAAAAIGARAYATGDRVAFSTAPDLRQAAHEAAHVVQQRGGVRPDGGVGRVGDPYEQHADAVAALVVRGESAEGLLDEHAHRGFRGGPAVQRIAETTDQLQTAVDTLATAAALAATNRAIDAIRRPLQPDDQPYSIPIGGTAHDVRGSQLGALRAAIQVRRAALGSTAGARASSVEDATEAGTRTPVEVERLIRNTLRAIARNESGEAHVAPPSHLDTAAGPSASYGSTTQATASHTTQTLLGGARHGEELSADARQQRRAYAEEHGISRSDLRRTRSIEAASDRIWNAIVRDGHDREDPELADDLETTGFSEADIDRMIQFREFRALLLAKADRFNEILQSPPPENDTGDGSRPRPMTRARAGALLADELMSDERVTALRFGRSDVVAYIHAGRFNRFPEDRQAWERVALGRHHETPHEGEEEGGRTLDHALEEAAQSSGGWDMSGSEFVPLIRDYVRANPDATDEQVVRNAAAHNGHSADYPDTIWRRYQAIVAEEAPDEADPEQAGQAAGPASERSIHEGGSR